MIWVRYLEVQKLKNFILHKIVLRGLDSVENLIKTWPVNFIELGGNEKSCLCKLFYVFLSKLSL